MLPTNILINILLYVSLLKSLKYYNFNQIVVNSKLIGAFLIGRFLANRDVKIEMCFGAHIKIRRYGERMARV